MNVIQSLVTDKINNWCPGEKCVRRVYAKQSYFARSDWSVLSRDAYGQCGLLLTLSPSSWVFFLMKIVIFHSKISISGLGQTSLDLYQSNQDCGGAGYSSFLPNDVTRRPKW